MVGKRYRLGAPVRAIHAGNGEKNLVLLPKGAVLTVRDYRAGERTVTVGWEKTEVIIFIEDIRGRGAAMPD